MTDNNKYQKWYDQLISRARTRTIEGYVERHHIVPKSLGGTDEKSNLVKLTAREHLIAHMLLPRFVENKKPMWHALWCMVNTNGIKVNSRLYEQAKIEFRSICTGIKRSPETCAKIRAVRAGKKHSSETRDKMRAAQTGKKLSSETRARMSAARKGRKGKKLSPGTIAKRQATRAANRALKPFQYSSERHHQSPVQLS